VDLLADTSGGSGGMSIADASVFSAHGSVLAGGSMAPAPAVSRPRKKAKSTSPKFEPSDEQSQHLLRILNQGTLMEILELYGIGSKRASLILSKRGSGPITSLKELATCGFGPEALNNFLQRNANSPAPAPVST